jgi:riboflavin kinase/FMN adenylyltransferase
MKKTFTGRIIEGSKKARELGFPTANMAISDVISGIYIGSVFVENNTYNAALFGDEKRGLLEAYILDFSENIYGKEATFTLIKKIREHGTFTNTESLRKAIASDVESTREYFRQPL